MAACLALILGATLWFVPHRSQPSGANTALDNAQAPTVTLSPSVKEEDADGRKQDSLPAPESAPVLDDSVSSLLFSVPAESSADSTTLHISDRKTIEALSALLVRTQPVQPLDADRTPLCVLEETSADGVTTRVTVWCDGKDVVFVSSTDTQYYRACRVFTCTRSRSPTRHFSIICCKTTTKNHNFSNILGNHLLETRENVCYNLSCLLVPCYFRNKQMYFLTMWCLLPLGG